MHLNKHEIFLRRTLVRLDSYKQLLSKRINRLWSLISLSPEAYCGHQQQQEE